MDFGRVFGKRSVAYLGIAGPLFALIGIMLAIFDSPWFSWRDNALSDLGVSPAANIFNFSLIIAAALIIIFIFHMWIKIKLGILWNAGLLVMAAAMAALVGLAVFTEHSDLHWPFSAAFFLLLLVSFLLLAPALLTVPGYKVFGLFLVLATIIGVASWLVDWGGGIAIPEAFSSFPACIWSMLMAVKILYFPDPR